MSPLEALNILNQATSALQVNRQVHLQIIEAVKVLQDLIREQQKQQQG